MAAKTYSTQYPDYPPDRYWINGLHDASIVAVESFDFPFDYNKFVREKAIKTHTGSTPSQNYEKYL